MARPKSADPDETRRRIYAAARQVAARDGLCALSARTIAAVAGVSASSVSNIKGGMTGIRERLITMVFETLIEALGWDDEAIAKDPLSIVASVLRADPGLPRLTIQVASWAGGHTGFAHRLAKRFENSWTVVHDHLAKIEIPNSPLNGLGTAANTAESVITLFFAIAFQLARQPTLSDDQLRSRL